MIDSLLRHLLPVVTCATLVLVVDLAVFGRTRAGGTSPLARHRSGASPARAGGTPHALSFRHSVLAPMPSARAVCVRSPPNRASASSTWRRSSSAIGITPSEIALGPESGSRTSAGRSAVRILARSPARTIARSIAFCSSRTLPGQRYAVIASAASGVRLRGLAPTGAGADAGGPPGAPVNLTVMAKMAPGYDAENGDWYHGVVSPDGTVKTQGRIGMCAGCHADAGTDHVFGVPSAAAAP